VKRTLATIVFVLGIGALFSIRAMAAESSYVIINDEASVKEMLTKLTSGEGVASLEKVDVYKKDKEGKAAILVTGAGGDGQRYNPQVPGWSFSIVEAPKTNTEYRYITFAWKKVGGTGIQLQLHGVPDTWGHRYHAGANEKNWTPSIQVSPDMPKEWTLVTRDLWTDWKTFTLTGIAFTAWSLPHGIWDHVVLHQTKTDPLTGLAVEPTGKLASAWASLKIAR
jgi:hypothetical protein